MMSPTTANRRGTKPVSTVLGGWLAATLLMSVVACSKGETKNAASCKQVAKRGVALAPASDKKPSKEITKEQAAQFDKLIKDTQRATFERVCDMGKLTAKERDCAAHAESLAKFYKCAKWDGIKVPGAPPPPKSYKP